VVSELQAVILAAGMGTRLKPITESIPKCLIKIGKKSILERQIEILNLNGIYDITVITGYKSDLIKKNANSKSFKIIENKKFKITNTLYSFMLALDNLYEDFLCLYGDLIFDPKIISSLINQEKKISLVVDEFLIKNDNHSTVIQNNKITQINLKNNFNDVNGQFIGISKFNVTSIPLLKKFFRNYDFKNNYNNEIITIFDFFISKKILEIFSLKLNLTWININDKKSLDWAQRYIS
tara:strand:- start:20 stop:730 length:711 start_codon:yes stop_codon:yes gene_type:complete